ncbi:hypothetical protein TFLX_04783 [Thermoflexales bacterium]|nr:hypothetical protein TFLX_04783 [Thermoflexales bacterium]
MKAEDLSAGTRASRFNEMLCSTFISRSLFFTQSVADLSHRESLCRRMISSTSNSLALKPEPPTNRAYTSFTG